MKKIFLFLIIIFFVSCSKKENDITPSKIIQFGDSFTNNITLNIDDPYDNYYTLKIQKATLQIDIVPAQTVKLVFKNNIFYTFDTITEYSPIFIENLNLNYLDNLNVLKITIIKNNSQLSYIQGKLIVY